MVPQAFVDAQVARFATANVPMLVHCNGDAAAEMLLDALDRVGESAPLGDHRTVMIHAQTVREDQIDRMAVLGVVPSYFSAHTFYWGDWHRDSVLGRERARRISPTRSTLARNMPFTVHNDAPVVPPDMTRLLWATANRLTRSGQVLGEAQRLDTLEALRAITANAAYQSFEECLQRHPDAGQAGGLGGAVARSPVDARCRPARPRRGGNRLAGRDGVHRFELVGCSAELGPQARRNLGGEPLQAGGHGLRRQTRRDAPGHQVGHPVGADETAEFGDAVVRIAHHPSLGNVFAPRQSRCWIRRRSGCRGACGSAPPGGRRANRAPGRRSLERL